MLNGQDGQSGRRLIRKSKSLAQQSFGGGFGRDLDPIFCFEGRIGHETKLEYRDVLSRLRDLIHDLSRTMHRSSWRRSGQTRKHTHLLPITT